MERIRALSRDSVASEDDDHWAVDLAADAPSEDLQKAAVRLLQAVADQREQIRKMWRVGSALIGADQDA